MESSNFKTVEALVSKIGQLTFQKYDGVAEVVATVTKPNAFSHVEGVGYHLPWSKTISKIWNQLNLKTQLLKLIEHSIYLLKMRKLRIIPGTTLHLLPLDQYWKSSRKYYQFIRIVAKIWNHHRSNFIIVHF